MTIQVLDRAVRILRVVAQLGPVSLTEISEAAQLPLPTTARIAKSLTESGILQRLHDRKYQLGARLVPIVTRLDPHRRSLEIVHPFVEQLSAATREDCGLAVMQGSEAVVVDWCYGTEGPRIIEPYSREIPLHCAFGMVLIAFQPAQWRKRYLESAKLRKLATGTVTEKTLLAAAIDQVRRTGLHMSIAQNVEGAGSLSAPVFDHLSRLYGALFVTAPLERLTELEIPRQKALLLDAAKRLTAELRLRLREKPAG